MPTKFSPLYKEHQTRKESVILFSTVIQCMLYLIFFKQAYCEAPLFPEKVKHVDLNDLASSAKEALPGSWTLQTTTPDMVAVRHELSNSMVEVDDCWTILVKVW